MLENLKHYFSRWKESKNYKHDLDALLGKANPENPLHERLDWAVDLMQWVRYKRPTQDDYSEIKHIKVPTARLRFLLMVLERRTDWKVSVAKTLRSIIHDVPAMELFAEIGLPQELGLMGEFTSRFFNKIMPERPLSEGMGQLFSALFPHDYDPEWMASLDPQVMGKLIELFFYEVAPEEKNWNRLQLDIEEALLSLVAQVSATGLNSMIRKRMGQKSFREIPFFKLSRQLDELLDVYELGDRALFLVKAKEFRKLIWNCINALREVYKHLNRYGVSVSIVYHVEAAQSKLKRTDDLIGFLMFEELDIELLMYFLIQLVQENQERKSLKALFNQNTRLLARKIVDRSAETGEHYITRDKSEYQSMFKKAAGGGAYTAMTVYLKFLIVSFHMPLFMEGFVASLNYSISFIAIQLSGFTLATKQPSMTASALAAKMQFIDTGESVEVLIDEIVHLVRSQVAGVLGNVGIVIPVVLIIDTAVYLISGHHLIGEEKAKGIIDSTNIFGPTIIYGAFTGVLLWFSSIFAGWMDNWFVFNNMKTTIMYNRRMNFIFGLDACKSVASYFEKNISALAASISLGFLLGFVPELMKFLGLGLDVRHVTLSSGSLAAAVPQYGLEVFHMKEFWFAVAGIILIAFLNLGVSFALALLTAIKSRNIKSIQRENIYKSLWSRFKKKPLSFFYPVENKLVIAEKKE
ncbi:MAG: site-specific recombinase [Bdellovibrionota bacterium]